MPAVVLVTFYSRNGETERLATAAAVGAVQVRAGIRMRRLDEPDREAALTRHPQSAETLKRMWKEYVPPREADVLAAHAIVLGLPGDVTPSSEVCAPFFELLRRVSAEGRLAGKVAAVVGTGAGASAAAMELRGMGLAVVEADGGGAADSVDAAVALGRQLASSVRL